MCITQKNVKKTKNSKDSTIKLVYCRTKTMHTNFLYKLVFIKEGCGLRMC